MGENRGTTETKRMTSIVRKLHLSWIGRKLSMYVGWDFFLFVVLTVGWLCDQEITRLGGIKAGYQRSIENFPSIKKMTYVVRNGNGKVLMDIEVYHTLLVIGILLAAVLVIQLLNLCTVYAREEQRIRHILAPINEIALKADELSKMTFSEDKYQQIEEAISSLQPEESELLSLGTLIFRELKQR